jgi:hypothetical protein
MSAPAASFQFIGRRTELKVLEQSEMVPVYGRRRVGKTELLLRFASDKPTVYFTASDKLRTPQPTFYGPRRSGLQPPTSRNRHRQRRTRRCASW